MSAIDSTLNVAWVFDMNACRSPTGVTRHALAQLEHLAQRTDVRLTAISGRISEPDGLAYWERLEGLPRRQLPLSTRDSLRLWRLAGGPPLEWWSGKVDWAYAPAELYVPTRKALRAVTSHDVLQDLRFGGPRRQALLDKVLVHANLILSVSRFNTEKLLQFYPECRGRVAIVPNAAEEIFFGEATARERAGVRGDLGLPPGVPYLLSVASFQPRKNLVRLVQAAGELSELVTGQLALVLLGTGPESEVLPIRAAISDLGKKAIVRLPGYRQGRPLLAAYAESTALAFSSTCESFGIPAVEAMAQGVPVALADSSALPEVGGEAGWYFDPFDVDSIRAVLRNLLDDAFERKRRVDLGRQIAQAYRWQAANDQLVTAFRGRRDG